jgi:hypothetical protein
LSKAKKLAAQYLCKFFEKILNSPNGIIKGLGELVHEKNQNEKI